MSAGPRGHKPYAYHEILCVEVSTPQDQLRPAYKKRALQLHPDKNINNPDAEEDFKLLNVAFHVLNDPNDRCAYERECRTWQHLSPDGSTNQQSPPTVHEDTVLRFFLKTIPDSFFSNFKLGHCVSLWGTTLGWAGVLAFAPGYVGWRTTIALLDLMPIFSSIFSIPCGILLSKSLPEFLSFLHGSLISTALILFPEYNLSLFVYWIVCWTLQNANFNLLPLEGPIRQLGRLTSSCKDLAVNSISATATLMAQAIMYSGTSAVHGGAYFLNYLSHLHPTKYFSSVPEEPLEYVAEEWVMLEGPDDRNDQGDSDKEGDELDLSDWVELEG